MQDLRIGDADARDYTLTAISDLVVAPDGGILVLQPQERLVRVYDAAGRFVRTIGRRGEGPGEFQRPASAGWKADTLWVQDPQLQRITLFGSQGSPTRSVTFSVQPPPGRRLPVYIPGSLLADGSVLGAPSGSAEALAALGGEIPDLRFSRAGEPLGPLAVLPLRHAFLNVPAPSGAAASGIYGRQPFSDAPIRKVAPDGAALWVVDRPVAAGPRNAFFTVLKLSPAGDTLLARRVPYRPRGVPASRTGAAVAELAAFAQRLGLAPNRPAAERLIRRHLFLPPYLPPVEAVVAGRDGTLWIQRESMGESTVTWEVLDAGGRLLGSLPAPARLRVLQAQQGMLWGVEHDEDDVPYVVRYRIRRHGGGSSGS